jgi:Domain of unknown function (DUF4267)
MSEQRARQLVAAIGLGAMTFGMVPMVAPRQFARLFGFPAPDLTTTSMMRSLGARDVVMGIGLWSAAIHGGNFVPWLLARALTDASDAAAVGAAVARGARSPRFVALGTLALGAAATEAVLYASVRVMRAGEQG